MKQGPALIAGQIVIPITRTTTMIGRTDRAAGIHPDIDIAPLAGGLVVSRRHANLQRTKDGFVLSDLGSQAGTLVNGERITAEVVLNDGDTVTIGSATLRFSPASEWPEDLIPEWERDAVLSTSTQNPAGLPLIAQLPGALAEGQLVLHYQPQVSLVDGDVVGVEALIRWNHESMGAIAPDRYLSLAEDSGYIRVLTSFAVEQACQAVAKWRREGRDVHVAVNISVVDLEDPVFPDKVMSAVDDAGAMPSDLTLEVTETGMMLNPGIAIAATEHLASLGFRVAIDDFGTGRSSLAYLKDLPAQEVKLDKTFASSNERDNAIVRSTVELAHDLGMTVVAEGVESDAVVGLLRAAGCDRAQGYLFGEPCPWEDVDLEARRLPSAT